MKSGLVKELWGEFIGTFILVFVGCGAVGVAVILGGFTALYQVAAVWGIGVTLAIMASKTWSPSHLNPAVTLAMCIARHHSWRRLLPYTMAQMTGAIVAGVALLMLFKSKIVALEKSALGRDLDLYIFLDPQHSTETAQMFGEFFPNPGYADVLSMTWPGALLAEALGTFLMLVFIFMIVKDIKRMTWKPAALIGLTVALLICIFAPFTQCGMNPARDAGPRLVAYFSGWGQHALPTPAHSAISVYVLGPLLGAALAAFVSKRK